MYHQQQQQLQQVNTSYESSTKNSVSSSASSTKTLKKPASHVIPEAPEREELTVQDMSEARESGIKYPLTPSAAVKNYQ